MIRECDSELSECLFWHINNDGRSIESRNEWVNAWYNAWLCVSLERMFELFLLCEWGLQRCDWDTGEWIGVEFWMNEKIILHQVNYRYTLYIFTSVHLWESHSQKIEQNIFLEYS